MGYQSLRHWSGKVILVILFFDVLGCLVGAVNLPRKEFVGIRANDIRRLHPKWVRLKSGISDPRSGRTRSDLEVSLAAIQVNSSAEAELLLEFSREITQDPLKLLSSWNSNNVSNYCSWSGVNCSSPTGPVRALNLSGYQLMGTVSPSLCGLQFLSSLDLSDNVFTGGIPTGIVDCSSLTFLSLASNQVSGDIPVELSFLSNLEELDLSANLLSNGLPPSLSNLSALRVLSLGANHILSDLGSLDWGAFAQLNSLNLSYNQFDGAFPESLSNCSALLTVDLSANSLSGNIPDIFGRLTDLQFLNLEFNKFSGLIPRSVGSLTALTAISLSLNKLTGSIPPEIGLLSQLEQLYLHDNFLTGSIPSSLVNCSSLTDLVLFKNALVGEIPPDIGLLTRLRYLYLWGNNLTGSIPPSLVNCTALTDLVINYNSLSGGIPEWLGTLSQLNYLYLSHNSFSGQVPDSLGSASNLLELVLQNNAFTGSVPSTLGSLKRLTTLDLAGNLLSDLIPSSLGNARALLSLSLAANHLSGKIPAQIGGLVNLQGLNLSNNLLTGGIPAELSNCTQLSVLDLSGNFLVNGIPSELAGLGALNQLFLNNNNLAGPISSALRETSGSLIEISLAYNSFSGGLSGYDFGSLRSLQVGLDLSHNLVSGPLPTAIGALQSVQKIDLSFNAFSGPITSAFEECTGLESLDLSSNLLDGNIPDSLINLKQLTYFNVSFNQLTGSVPDSGQFANFTNGSYLGNPGLCGRMLSHKCKKSCSFIHCHKLWVVILPAVAAGVAGALALGGIWFLFIAKTSDSRGLIAPGVPNASHFTSEVEGLSVGDIVAATNGFSDGSIMGVGSKSTVFAGVLPSGVMIAVKRLEMKNDDKGAAQLYRELQRLSKLEHPNLLKVYGLFSSGDLKALALEYMPNGSLRKQMYDGETCRLTWAERLNIALAVAEAMVHLHHSGSKPVIHMDLKPSNILLDADMEPKVADYGISNFVNHETQSDTTITSNLYGTIGYIPPEYGTLRSVSTMGDVYNFGVVLMELFTRKQPTDDMFGQDVTLRSWVADAFPGRISQILDSTLRQELAQNEQDVGIHLMVRLAIACTRNAPKERPTMIEARDMLLEIKSIEQPFKGGA